jgi:Arc/MetJ-type ribon-helix-helix transcriptional regulator
MQISVSKPDLVRFVEEQVSQGRFTSVEEVVEAALLRLRDEERNAPLDSETLAKIRTSREQLDRGEGLDFKDALHQLRSKYAQR